MTLSAGTRLGPYVVVRSIGAGGMGEIYHARDTRLERDVAIKVLPAEFSNDARLRARFLLEAKSISALAHPHICTLHDIGHADGVDFLVMELLDGQTLLERMRSAPLPLDELLRIGIEIADALETAHRHHIVHRDLKPGNVMVTKSGTKLLDFGLAKALAGKRSDEQTEVAPLTKEGAVVGTLDFMAPEQLNGGEIDARTDVFALGNILYRMATGRAPFDGSSDAQVVAAIVSANPSPPRSHRPDLPRALERLIESCLRKDPDERVQTAHDVKLQLETIADSFNGVAPARPPRFHVGWIAIAVAAAIGAIALLITRQRQPATPAPVQRFAIPLPPLAAEMEYAAQDFAVSPDGSRLVIALDLGNGKQLFVRRFDRNELTPLPATANALSPFFSPDSQWVGFASEGKLKKVALSGGNPVAICDAPRYRGATWGADDTIVFAPMSHGEGLFQVSADGGTPRRVTDLAKGEHSHRWPRFIPGTSTVVYAIDDWGADYNRKKVAVLDLRTGKGKVLITGATGPRFAAGHLLFGRERALFAQRFDVEKQQLSGLPVPVADSVITHAGTGSVLADVSQNGTLVYLPYVAAAYQRELVWADRRGAITPLGAPGRPYQTPRLSPDGRQLVVGAGETRATDLWLIDLDTKSSSRIAPEGKSVSPVWSADGRHIFYASNREGLYNIYVMNADGSDSRRITDRMYWPFPSSVLPDGTTVIAEEQHPLTSYDIWSFRTDGSEVTPLLGTTANEAEPEVSPDGRWLAYASSESGRYEVYVQRYPPAGRKWTVSQNGGRRPRWSADGRELFFRADRKLMAASVTTAPSLVIRAPQALFEGDFAMDYDVHPDGRFLMMRESARSNEPLALALVLNWTAELQTAAKSAQ